MKNNLYEPRELSSSNEEEFVEQANKTRIRKTLTLGLLISILVAFALISRGNKGSALLQNMAESIEDQKYNNKNENLEEIKSRNSLGYKILIGADNYPQKLSGVESFAAGNYRDAQVLFSNSLKLNSNDPETLIYLNNSLAAIKEDTVTIAVSVPIGGSLDVAKEILRGVAQAQNEVNKLGGVDQNGLKKMVQVQIANDDNDPEIAKHIAANFVNNPKILGVVGHNSSSASIAAAPVYQEGKLVMLSPTSVARKLSVIGGNYTFRTTPSTRVLAEKLAEYSTKESSRHKITICYDSGSDASVSFKDEFSLAVFEQGGEIADTECDFGGDDFDSEKVPSKAISEGSKAIVLIPSVNKMNQALEVIKSSQNRLKVFGNHSLYTYQTLETGQSEANGMVLPVPWHYKLSKKTDFNKNAVELWGTPGSWRTATSYDATKALLAGLNIGSTRQELQQALSNPGFSTPGVLGDIVFQNSGDRQIEGLLVKVQPGKNSGTGFDFSPVGSNLLEDSRP